MRKELALSDDEITALYRSGVSARELAERVGLSQSAMGERIKKLGILRSRRESILLIRDRLGSKRENHYRWKGGVSKRPDLAAGRWKETRARILERDGYACTECGGSRRLSVHHIQPDGGDADTNLKSLCSACHLLHHKPWEARWGRSESYAVHQ